MFAGTIRPDLETAVARVRRLLDLLSDLSGMGMDLVRDLHRRVMAGEGAANAALNYCRLAKAIRQLVALEMRLARALADVESGRWASEEAERELAALAAQAREEAAVEALESAIREAGDAEAAERLIERLDDWHAERAVERDFSERSVGEIVAGACKAMGLKPDPDLLDGETMGQTLADAVRAYAAALVFKPERSGRGGAPADGPAPPGARPKALAEARAPPG